MCVKNTSLCRPVTAEDVGKRVLFARAGSKCNADEGLLVGVHDRGVCVAWDDSESLTAYSRLDDSDLINIVRLAPLFWLEGNPIYKGDTVFGTWSYAQKEGYVVDRIQGVAKVWFTDASWTWVSNLTTQKPKTKHTGWVNIYKKISSTRDLAACASNVYSSREAADAVADGVVVDNRIACIQIEWEE